MITRGAQVFMRGEGKSAVLDLPDMALKGAETKAGEVEARLEASLNATMSPAVVAVHVETLSSLQYGILLGPAGSIPRKEWWKGIGQQIVKD